MPHVHGAREPAIELEELPHDLEVGAVPLELEHRPSPPRPVDIAHAHHLRGGIRRAVRGAPMRHQAVPAREVPALPLDGVPEETGNLLVREDRLAVREPRSSLDLLHLALQLAGRSVPLGHDCEVGVVDAGQTRCYHELAPRKRLDALDAPAVGLAEKRDGARSVGHDSTRGGAPYGASASGTSPWKFSRSASTMRSTTVVPLSVWTGSGPCSRLTRVLSRRAW